MQRFDLQDILCIFVAKKRLGMNIIYDDSNKSVRCWKNFIENPSGREEMRSFKKTFGQNLINKAVRLHEKMLGHESVGTYNKEYKTDNQTNSGTPLKRYVRLLRCCRTHCTSVESM